MAGRDVVYVDPDNGLEIDRVGPHFNKGPKYVYYDEFTPYLGRGQSLVVYHHLNREKDTTWESQVQERLQEVRTRLGPAFALLYRPGTGRVFFVVPSEAHREILQERAGRFAEHPCWSKHFTLYGPDDLG